MSTKAPVWFMVVAVLALLWNAAGVFAYAMDMMMSAEDMAKLSQGEQDLYAARPMWVELAFGVATIAGLLGSVLLVMKKSYASYLYAISLIAVIAQMSYNFFVSNMFEILGKEMMVMPIMVILIAFGLLLFSKMATKKGWLS